MEKLSEKIKSVTHGVEAVTNGVDEISNTFRPRSLAEEEQPPAEEQAQWRSDRRSDPPEFLEKILYTSSEAHRGSPIPVSGR
jgi:hypothetical protein